MVKRCRDRLAALPLLLLCGCSPPVAAPPAGQEPPDGSASKLSGLPAPAVPAALPAPQTPAAAPEADVKVLPDPSFTPLPSPEQVKRAQPIGQLDPFRPLSQEIRDLVVKPTPVPSAVGSVVTPIADPARSRPQTLDPPPGWEVTGLIGGVGRPQAVVSYQGSSGTVGVGDVGSAVALGPNATNLLPEGWRVAAIDLKRGAIVLRFKGQTTTQQL